MYLICSLVLIIIIRATFEGRIVPGWWMIKLREWIVTDLEAVWALWVSVWLLCCIEIGFSELLLSCWHGLILAFDEIVHEFCHVIGVTRGKHGFLSPCFIEFLIGHAYAPRLEPGLMQTRKVFAALSGLEQLKVVQLSIQLLQRQVCIPSTNWPFIENRGDRHLLKAFRAFFFERAHVFIEVALFYTLDEFKLRQVVNATDARVRQHAYSVLRQKLIHLLVPFLKVSSVRELGVFDGFI